MSASLKTYKTNLRSPSSIDLGDLRKRFSPTFELIAEGNLGREAERIHPHEQVRLLVDAGFSLIRIPQELGGIGASLQQTFILLSELAEADPNVAHIWRNHLAFVENILYSVPSPTSERWLERFFDGDFIGGGWTEANNGTFANMQTKLVRENEILRLTGRKYYSTGSLFADWLDVLSEDEEGRLVAALVRRDQDGVELIDDWFGIGQQTTGSGSANYRNAVVDPSDVIPLEDRFSYQTPFYQTSLHAVLTGISRAARRDVVSALKARKRNYSFAVTRVASEDPQLLEVIGQISAHVYAAEGALLRSAKNLDDIATARITGDTNQETKILRNATLELHEAQLVISEAALQATALVFDALGSSGTDSSLGLDRHWRNARTLVSHNPRVYKQRLVGDWYVNAKDPLSIGLSGQGA